MTKTHVNGAYHINPIGEQKRSINELLHGYWSKDVWDSRDSFFENLHSDKWCRATKTIDFSTFSPSIRDEVKYLYASRLQKTEIKLSTVISYGSALKCLAEFFQKYYPDISSIVELPYEKALLQWRSLLADKGMQLEKVCRDGYMKSTKYVPLLCQFYDFFINFYDTRDEYEKDVWDCRKIPGTRITETGSEYYLHFSDIPAVFRGLVKQFVKFRTTNNSQSQCCRDIMSLRLFTKHIHVQEPSWQDLTRLTRKHMEAYLSWYKGYTEGWKSQHISYFVSLRIFLDYIQRAQYPEAPALPVVLLLFKEDYPRRPQRTEHAIKYIPEGVLHQLEENLEHLTPAEYIPIVLLLRATGWRISDILNLRYDTCLERTAQGWYLCGDIPKVQVLDHRIPITDEIAAVVQSVAHEVKQKSTTDNNPNRLLFVRFDGMRKGRCPLRKEIQRVLNRLAQSFNITDDQGNVFHFKNHAFRHTKGVELINNGMNILHVQKWMAHVTPEMTLRYAKILDTTMRKSWEEATKKGVFKLDATGNIRKIDLSEIQNEDIIEWEYIRHNLDAVRMPLGYCMKPNKQECHTQLNPCLTCRNLCTTPDFLPQFEREIQETQALIELGKAQGRTLWVEKNQVLLGRYETIVAELKNGNIHHQAGKTGREYRGEERNNGKKP